MFHFHSQYHKEELKFKFLKPFYSILFFPLILFDAILKRFQQREPKPNLIFTGMWKFLFSLILLPRLLFYSIFNVLILFLNRWIDTLYLSWHEDIHVSQQQWAIKKESNHNEKESKL